VTPATLFLGGARSGKSRCAQQYAEDLRLDDQVYLATGQVLDAEMQERVARHQRDRGRRWRTEEVPFELPERLLALDAPDRVCLVDCLTMWVSNMLCQEMAREDVERRCQALIGSLSRCRCAIVLVGNEVGTGLVPESALGRRFRDVNGELNQSVAAVCSNVFWMAAGLPIAAKVDGQAVCQPGSLWRSS